MIEFSEKFVCSAQAYMKLEVQKGPNHKSGNWPNNSCKSKGDDTSVEERGEPGLGHMSLANRQLLASVI